MQSITQYQLQKLIKQHFINSWQDRCTHSPIHKAGWTRGGTGPPDTRLLMWGSVELGEAGVRGATGASRSRGARVPRRALAFVALRSEGSSLKDGAVGPLNELGRQYWFGTGCCQKPSFLRLAPNDLCVRPSVSRLHPCLPRMYYPNFYVTSLQSLQRFRQFLRDLEKCIIPEFLKFLKLFLVF